MKKIIKMKDWTEEMLRDVVTLTDAAFAAKYNYKTVDVAAARNNNKIKIRKQHPRPPRLNPHSIVWTESMVQELGKVHDREVAKKYGISIQAIRDKRALLGIEGIKLPGTLNMPTKYFWPENEVELLQTLKNVEIIELLGFPNGVVANRRKRLGIPAPVPVSKIDTVSDNLIEQRKQSGDARLERQVLVESVLKLHNAGVDRKSIATELNVTYYWVSNVIRQQEKVTKLEVVKQAEDALGLSIDKLGLDYKLANVMKINDVMTLGDLTALGQRELIKMPNIGKRSLGDIIVALEKFNLTLS